VTAATSAVDVSCVWPGAWLTTVDGWKRGRPSALPADEPALFWLVDVEEERPEPAEPPLGEVDDVADPPGALEWLAGREVVAGGALEPEPVPQAPRTAASGAAAASPIQCLFVIVPSWNVRGDALPPQFR
jgi:hypothetical protein